MAKHVRIEGLTANRVYGPVCSKHPEMEGLRQKPTVKKYLNADCEIKTYLARGMCIGCAREKDKRRVRGKLHYGGGGWQGLGAALNQMGGM